MNTKNSEQDISTIVDHLFRRKSGQMVSTLTRILGPNNIDLAENVVQDALIKALKTWPFTGVPKNPSAWIIQVAKNLAIDSIRREQLSKEKYEKLENDLEGVAECTWFDSDDSIREEFKDDLLGMLFICCHPCISTEASIALALKTVFGFGLEEISKAFLVGPRTIEQRITRAKKTIRANKIKFEIPEKTELDNRLDSVLSVLYLIFNEGYLPYEGDEIVKSDLCKESIRLIQLLATHRVGAKPKVYALLSLFLFQSSRIPLRQENPQVVLLLEDQDRSKWDRDFISKGFYFLDKAMSGHELTSYHLEAGIAACHSSAKTFKDTDWDAIVNYYDDLCFLRPSSVSKLNRAVAIFYRDGVNAGLNELTQIKDDPQIENYYLFHATMGEFCFQNNELSQARKSFLKAVELVKTKPEKEFLRSKINQLDGR